VAIDDAALTEAKSRLRKDVLDRRAAIPEDARKAAARAIADHGLPPGLGQSPVVVSSYWAIGAELDPGPLERKLRKAGHRICLPVIQKRAEPMLFRVYNPGDPTGTRKWGIREPTDAAERGDPDILLMPLAAFDLAGWRIGYGGGYYDRTLHDLRARKPVVTVGLAFDEQRIDAVPHLDYDERLDWILTPSGHIRCA
jgi:5-formyltetrahydrofolate cyclo-ligase